MRIGIDAHSVGAGKGGNETYFRSLLKSLVCIDEINEYVVYGARIQSLKQMKLGQHRFKVRQVRPSNAYLRIPFAMPIRIFRESLDIFHAQHIIPPLVKCRVVTTIPDLAYEHHPEYFSAFQVAWSKRLISGSAKRADHIITVSEFSRADLICRYGVDPAKVTVTYEAAEEEYFPRDHGQAREYVARRYGITRPFILYVGRLQGRKNLVRLVQAYGNARRHGADHQLVLVGKKDWGAEHILSTIAELGLNDDVLLTGYTPTVDLPWFYNAADVFAYVSFFEGFGLPVIEAMACGTPVVTSMGSSLEEVAGDAALIVDPSDLTMITAALERLIGDSNLRQELGRRGVRRSSQFDLTAMARKTLTIYERVCGTEKCTGRTTETVSV